MWGGVFGSVQWVVVRDYKVSGMILVVRSVRAFVSCLLCMSAEG